MRCLFVTGSALEPVLDFREVPNPKPADGEALIKVSAAGAMRPELQWYPTWHTKSGPARENATPAHEFSGTIIALGESTNGFKLHAEVFGMNDWFAEGAMAEYCLAPVSAIAAKPSSLNHAEAAVVPISALTAWQALFDHAKTKPGDRVLIHGGAGAVGAFAVQFAKSAGAQVFASASARDLAFVKDLGADKAIDYQADRFEDVVNQVDVVFDTVGGETLQRSWSVLAPEGRLRTIASDGANSPEERVRKAFFIVEPKQAQLEEIGSRIDKGTVQVFLASVVPFSRAPEAYAEDFKRAGRGKVAVSIVP